MKTKKMKKLTKAESRKIDEMLLSWYSLGWSVRPDRAYVEDAVHLLKAAAVAACACWQHKIRTGREAPEDVSPSEGFLMAAYLLEHIAKEAGVESVKTSVISPYFLNKDKKVDEIRKALDGQLNKIVPGYAEEPEHESRA